jgi:predicted RNase H-like nuclease
MRLAGVDGCRRGWVAAVEEPGGAIAARVFESFAALSDALGEGAVIAVDIPIGLPDRSAVGGRGPERAVRPLLGGRQSSVFSIPSRAAVYAGVDVAAHPEDGARYRHACAVAMATCEGGRKVSKQGFYIFPKIVEVDRRLQEGLPSGQRVVETHPEVAFWAMNGERPLAEPKKVKGKPFTAGLDERRALLIGAGLPPAAIDGPKLHGAGLDDVIDAFAGLVVARAVAAGTVRSFPSPPERDAYGLEVAIWAGRS